MEAVVRFEGAVAMVLEKLVELGYFKTKSEAIRAGVLELGKEYQVLKTPKELEAELVVQKVERIDREIDAGKRKLTPLREVLREAKARRK
jgi:Arc/MetJ-type ribon-helix-helix transcriptional regulator